MSSTLEELRLETLAEDIEFEPEFDGYVYVLKCSRDGDVIWYVGATTDIDDRYQTHCKVGGDFSGPKDGMLVGPDETDFDVYLAHLETFIQSPREGEVEFRRRLLKRERERICEVAIEHNTNQVYGG